MAESFGPQDALKYLVSQGYQPVQAAALVGNMMQESGMNPQATNPKEGAFGLIQWRLDRLQKLQDFAKERGSTAADPQVQLDFIGREMGGPEAKAAAPFMAATDLPSANDALKKYIRYGDKSQEARLANAQGLLPPEPPPASPLATEPMPVAPPAAAPMPMAAPAQAAAPVIPAQQTQAPAALAQAFGSLAPPQQPQQKADPFGLVRDDQGGTPIDMTRLRAMLAKLQTRRQGIL